MFTSEPVDALYLLSPPPPSRGVGEGSCLFMVAQMPWAEPFLKADLNIV